MDIWNELCWKRRACVGGANRAFQARDAIESHIPKGAIKAASTKSRNFCQIRTQLSWTMCLLKACS